jgi:predicted alpha-1,2-mannosidase
MISRRSVLKAALTPAVLGLAQRAARNDGKDDPTTLVNVFAGTGGHGHTYPGAAVPFGAVQLSPDTYNVGWDRCSGYHLSDSSIMGFSHTHLSGTGIGDMLDVLVMPGTGPSRIVPGSLEHPEEGYRSRFSHDDEHAEPGYYSVFLRDYKIKAELTATQRAGIHRYTFPQSGDSHFIVDLAHSILGRDGAPPRVLSAEMKVIGNDTIVGGRRTNIWALGRHIYFALKFSKPFLAAELFAEDKPLAGDAREAAGKSLKCIVRYKTSPDEVIHVKVGLSGTSAEGALKNLEADIPDWDFSKVRRAAHDAWSRELSRITAETPDLDRKRTFYTALYHTLLAPTLYDDVDGQYRGMDGQLHRVPAGLHNYSTFSLWDTYRALHPLFTLAQTQRVPDLVNCLIRMAQESPQGMPVWPLQGKETGCMTGYHSAVVIAEACVKGFRGLDLAAVYPAIKRRAMEDAYRGLDYYRKLGYIPCDKEEESATKTLEYSYDDWAVAHVARALGNQADYKALVARSGNYRNLFDKSVGFIRPRLENGEWAAPFDPKLTGTSKKWRDFTESNSWQGTWAAQHDPAGYIALLGSREAFIQKLDALFEQSTDINGEVPLDMTGLVGMYAHGNEPSHHIAYLYAYAGASYKTQARVRDLVDRMYKNTPDGLAGNEDCGQMSAWYIMSALGFYAVDPASGNYVFGSPLFESAAIDLGNGKKLTLQAKGASRENKYIQSVMFNGKPYDKPWFRHSDIANGGTFVFEMGSRPNRDFGADKAAAPPSMSTL